MRGLGEQLRTFWHPPKLPPRPIPALPTCRPGSATSVSSPRLVGGHTREMGAMNVTLDSNGELCGVSLSHIKKKIKIPNFLVLSSVLKEFLIFQEEREVIYTYNYKKGTGKSWRSSKWEESIHSWRAQEYFTRRGI